MEAKAETVLPPSSPLVSDGVDGIRTTRMLERAIRQRWPITDEQRQAIIDRQIVIASRKNGKPREQSVAAKTIAAFDKLNIEEVKLELQIGQSGKPEQHIHLHQQMPASVNLDKLTDEQLNNLEQLLIAASPTITNDSGSADTAG